MDTWPPSNACGQKPHGDWLLEHTANDHIQTTFGIQLPIIQAPMAGAQASAMAIAVSNAGGLGSLPCAMLDAVGMRKELTLIAEKTNKPINVNFFCH